MAEDAAMAAAAAVISDILGESAPAAVDDISGTTPSALVEPGDLTGVYHRVEAPDPSVAVYARGDAGEQAAPVEAPAQPEPQFSLPTWESNTEGIEDLLSEPDEPEYELEDSQDAEPVLANDEYDDPNTSQLKAQLAKLQKQNKWLHEQRARDNEKEWRKEAARRFPLADVDEIAATSRRAFLRKAQEQHSRYESKIKPLTEAIEGLRLQALSEAKTQARQEAAQAWGQPRSGVPVHAVEAQAEENKLDRRNFRSFHEYAAAKLKAGKYGPI